MIERSRSHQQVLVQLMADYSSMFGLRVKVLGRDMDMFPSGHHFHRDVALMKKIIQEEVTPEIFHMSWTTNKRYKKKFFEQLGEWYVKDECIGKDAKTVLELDKARYQNSTKGDTMVDIDSGRVLISPCCVKTPKVICHYKDKPSKIPCKDSPVYEDVDDYEASFW